MTDRRDSDLRIVDAPDAQRYEARIDELVVGFTRYRLTGDRILFHHTEVDPAFEGRGIGGRLAAGALDDALARGLRVIVGCPFIGAYLKRHPERAMRVSMSRSQGGASETA
ncbi:MAG: GNAT family N-acetyltransferase [Chloroflexota bacterium]